MRAFGPPTRVVLALLLGSTFIPEILSGPIEKADKRHNVKSSSDNNVDEKLVVKNEQPGPPLSACVTRECIGASYRILNHIDMSVNPCDDFYKVKFFLKKVF